jgi:hypothetical protein
VIARGKSVPVPLELVQRLQRELEQAGETIDRLSEGRSLRADEVSPRQLQQLAREVRDAEARDHLRALEVRK